MTSRANGPAVMYTASDGRAEPFKAVPALARALHARGAAIRENCAVRALDVAAGRVAGVVTEHGRVRADAVVCAAGAWSTLFLGESRRAPAATERCVRPSRAPRRRRTSTRAARYSAKSRFAVAQDGGYTVAASGTDEHFVGADYAALLIGVLARVASQHGASSTCDSAAICCRDCSRRAAGTRTRSRRSRQIRVLNPAPSPRALQRDARGLDQTRCRNSPTIPFEDAWAGMIDVTARRGAGDGSRREATRACTRNGFQRPRIRHRSRRRPRDGGDGARPTRRARPHAISVVALLGRQPDGAGAGALILIEDRGYAPRRF